MTMAQSRSDELRADDFEDISLYNNQAGLMKLSIDMSNLTVSPTSSFLSSSFTADDHGNVSNASTPTLSSDVSSLRSSMSSLSSPAIGVLSKSVIPRSGSSDDEAALRTYAYSGNRTQPRVPALRASQPVQQPPGAATQPAAKGNLLGAVCDTTSMASISRLPSMRKRSRKQREIDFDQDPGEDFWPADGLMFNVPMSPALYAQQRQINARRAAQAPANNIRTSGNRRMVRRRPGPPAAVAAAVRAPGAPGMRMPRPNGPLPGGPMPNGCPSGPGYLRGRPAAPPACGQFGGGPREDYSSLPPGAPRPSPGDGDLASWGITKPRARSSSQMSNTSLPSIKEFEAMHSTAGLDDLDDDARYITLAYAAEGSLDFNDGAPRRKASSASTPSSSRHSTSRVSVSSTRSSMSDDAPRRKSLTRPENLPPKSEEEERRHMRQYERLMASAAAAERKREELRRQQFAKQEQQRHADEAEWERWLADRNATSQKHLTEMLNRGIPDRVRGAVWMNKAASAGERLDDAPEASEEIRLLVAADAENVHNDLGLFRHGQALNEALIEVTSRYVAAHKEITYQRPLASLVGVLLLFLDAPDAYTVLSVILHGTLPGAVLAGNEQTAAANYSTFMKALRQKLPQLHQHFVQARVNPRLYLDVMMASLLSAQLPAEVAAHVIDKFLFEGDSVLLCAALRVVQLVESRLYQDRDSIIFELTSPLDCDDHELFKVPN